MTSFIKRFKFFQNPYLLFFPFLVVFIIYVLMFPTNGLEGDQPRYLWYAHNLIHGFFSPSPPDVLLQNGPGFPLILVPFLALGLPLIWLTILNAFFYYFSIIFLYKSLQLLVSQKITLFFSFFWACYYLAYQNLPFIHTETFTYFLVSIFIFALVKVFKPDTQRQAKKYILLSGFIMGYIVLTKIAFGYVLMFMLAGNALLWITKRKAINYRKGFVIALIAFATVAPYLIYTYTLTGRMFFWSTNGGESLYWGSTPYKGEYGDWKLTLEQGPVDMGNYDIPGSGDSLKAHHQKDYDEIYSYKYKVEQQDAFYRIAKKNILTHPLKYLENCFFNASRMIFHYPFSMAIQRPKVLFVFPVNGIILTFILFCLIPTFLNWRKLIYPIRFMLIFSLLYFCESSMVTAYVRMFTVIVPILFIWFALIFQKSVRIKINFFDANKR